MKNKIIAIILAVSSLIIMSLLGTKLLNKDFLFVPTDQEYKHDSSYLAYDTDEFTTYLKGTWEDVDSIAYIELDVVYDFKLIKANSKSTILGVYFNSKSLIFESQIVNGERLPFFNGDIIVNNQVVKEIDYNDQEDYTVSLNQFLFMYEHNNKFYNEDTLKYEKVESVRIKFNFKFKSSYSGLLATAFKSIAVNQVNGRLKDIDEIFYNKDRNIVTTHKKESIFKRVEYSNVGNINLHLTNTKANLT